MPEISKRSHIRNADIQLPDKDDLLLQPREALASKATGIGATNNMKPNPQQSIHNSNINKHAQQSSLPENFDIERGETQRNVNASVLKNLVGRIPPQAKILDLPCGTQIFLEYLKQLHPMTELIGADIVQPDKVEGIEFVKMDLTKEFEIPRQEQFDVITSISGVMMFSNTQSFVENCAVRLKKNGIFLVTNDNSLTIMDRLRYLFLGRVRLFNPLYEDNESMTQNIPIMELIRLMRVNGMDIEKIQYTSMYLRDLIFLPLVLLIYPIQYLYLLRIKSSLPKEIKNRAYSFKHLLFRHYIIIGKKR
jgi:2-polyprenyl-3-methyl-5-hydroxy-6-metoxy-1,4-benzoquinol methylase